MEAVGSRLSRASSRYGAPAVFSGPVRKWRKKWVHVTPSSVPNNNNSHSHTNNNNNTNNASSRLLLRRWTPTTADDTAAAASSDEPPRRKFRYTPVSLELRKELLQASLIAVLEEQKKMMDVKAENEPSSEGDQLAAEQTNVTHEMLEETKDSNIDEFDLGVDFQSNNVDDENNQNSDDQLEQKYLVGGP